MSRETGKVGLLPLLASFLGVWVGPGALVSTLRPCLQLGVCLVSPVLAFFRPGGGGKGNQIRFQIDGNVEGVSVKEATS